MSHSNKQIIKLVKGCMVNDRSAQELLYKLFYADMLRLCCRYLKTDTLAKEALNMGFLKVFQHMATFNANKGELGAWIRSIMIRTCIDLSRSEQKFNAAINEITISDDVFLSPSVLEKLYAEDLLQLVRVLPNATQVVFNLSVVDGYSHKEIAQKLAIHESTSRWHLAEGKKQLRTLLEARNQDYLTENHKKIR